MNTEWRYAWSKPTVTGDLKTHVQDFYVEEQLGFEPDGKGEFCFVFIEKEGVNTDFLAKRLAQIVGIAPNKVTYSGVKIGVMLASVVLFACIESRTRFNDHSGSI